MCIGQSHPRDPPTIMLQVHVHVYKAIPVFLLQVLIDSPKEVGQMLAYVSQMLETISTYLPELIANVSPPYLTSLQVALPKDGRRLKNGVGVVIAG